MVLSKKASIYISTLYFAEGLPYAIVMMLSAVFFKTLGASNIFIGLTSFLYLPWVLKFLWAPLVDWLGSKGKWIIICQFILSFLSMIIAFLTLTPQVVAATVIIFMLMAFVSATQDIAIDALYLDLLNEQQQAFYVGFRNAAYKMAWLLASGALIYLAGFLANQYSFGLAKGWMIAFLVLAIIFIFLAVFHLKYLPAKSFLVSSKNQINMTISEFFKIMTGYFKQKAIIAIVIYILTFRLGDALMLKQAPNFLLDPTSKGGLALTVSDIGLLYGTVGVIFLLLGGIVGGWMISVLGLKRFFWPAAIVQNLAILLYWLLAFFKPSIIWIYIANSMEQFAYGIGVAAYTVFLLSTIKSEFKAAHYAMATALMALGMMVPGALSGYLWEMLGYQKFFLVSFLATIPGMIAIFYLPLWQDNFNVKLQNNN